MTSILRTQCLVIRWGEFSRVLQRTGSNKMNKAVIVGLILAITISAVQANVIWDRYQDAINYVPRPGYCPHGEQGKAINCGNGCRADQDCPDGGKCCSTACGRTCKTPVPHEPRQNDDLRG